MIGAWLNARPILMCLRCGYRSNSGDFTAEDNDHSQRCGYFIMVVRYVASSGRIYGGARDPDWSK